MPAEVDLDKALDVARKTVRDVGHINCEAADLARAALALHEAVSSYEESENRLRLERNDAKREAERLSGVLDEIVSRAAAAEQRTAEQIAAWLETTPCRDAAVTGIRSGAYRQGKGTP
jgi:transcriptional regulator GlxA family with amidase domain